MSLSWELHQIKTDFDHNGYVVIRSFLAEPDLEELKAELDRYIAGASELPSTDVFYEDPSDPSTMKQLARIEQHNRYFAELIGRQRWASLAQTLLADDVVSQGLQWFNKPPRIGRPTPPHQDGHYFMLEPNEALTMWLALDVADEFNGCVRYVPGSHRCGLRSHGRTETFGFSQGITDFSEHDRLAEIPIRAKPGDLLLHHSVTIHRADGNSSDRHRRSLALTYYAASAKQDVQGLAAYQQDLYREQQST